MNNTQLMGIPEFAKSTIYLRLRLGNMKVQQSLIDAVVDLAFVSPKEAFQLIYKKVKKREMYDIIQLLEKIYKLEEHGT